MLAVPKSRPRPLSQCALDLAHKDVLGPTAPAYITLKRWAGAGALKTAQVLQPGYRRPLYKLDELAKIAAARLGRAVEASEPAPRRQADAAGGTTQRPVPTATQSGDPNRPSTHQQQAQPLAATDPAVLATLSLIAQTLVEIRDSLATTNQRDQAVANGLSNLDATRKMLMSKYDSEAQGLKNRVQELERDNASLRTANSPIDVGKLNVLLSRVSDQLAGLHS